MTLLIRKCPKCSGWMSEKDEDGDVTCLYCGFIEYTPIKESIEDTERMNYTIEDARSPRIQSYSLS